MKPIFLRHVLRLFVGTLRRLRGDGAGNVAIVAALAMTTLAAAVGGGIDLSRAFMARQQLSEVAALACQYASRPSIIQTIASSYSGANGSALYQANVTGFITKSLSSQKFPWTQTVAAPLTVTPSGPASVSLAANVPTTFMKIFNVGQLAVGATSNCYGSPAVINPILANGNSNVIVQEGFENSACSGTCWLTYGVNGQPFATEVSAVNAFTPTVGYTGTNGTQWYTMGYCLEVDAVNVIKSSVPEGSHSAELDCDNGQGGSADRGNSSISTKTYMAAGTYELRYNYVSRVDYPDYDPVYLCGSSASDLAWANDTNATSAQSNVLRTNQINVYLDLNTNGAPPTHTTIDGTQTLAGSNLIDMCVYAPNWIQRSVRINVATPGFYWLSFAADGTNDSAGGQLDNIMLCNGSCTGPVQDNFPPSWLAANNGGVNKVLFEDTFESPAYSPDFSNWINKGGNLNLSKGTSGTSSSGWPALAASGWATAPFNQINYILQGAYQGSQYIALDGYNASGGGSRNRLISRPFLLDPGYYQVSYTYVSDVDFSVSGVNSTYCYAAPASGAVFPATFATQNANIRFYQPTVADGSTNIVGAFMANGQLVSTPIGGGGPASTTSYANPDGSVSTNPTVPPDNVTWSNYDATAVNPVIDVCGYSPGFAWVPRGVSVKITKPGMYWLTFSANGGAADGNGGGIDDVKLTALGSLSMSNPPTSALTTIPVPAPQPDTVYTNNGAFNGFSIVADPSTPGR